MADDGLNDIFSSHLCFYSINIQKQVYADGLQSRLENELPKEKDRLHNINKMLFFSSQNSPLPQTMEDLEEMAKRTGSIFKMNYSTPETPAQK